MFPGTNARERMVCLNDFEAHARKILPLNALGYYQSGACGEETLRLNVNSFKKLRIRPRVLVNVSKRSVKCEVFGEEISCPIGVAPSAMQKLAHSEGENANVKAVEKFGTIYILSTLSTTSLEEVARSAPNVTKWFQLYVYKDRDLTRSLVQRAERAGFKALVVTVDTAVFGIRYKDARNNFTLPPHLNLANFTGLESKMGTSEGSSLFSYVNSLFDDSLSWSDIEWLQSITQLPVVVKGVLTAEDAIIAADIGVKGILVSNHGGRQLDTSPSSIEALPEISKAVGHRVEVFLDGGVRHGTDVLKAIALGAKMVFIGRPALWGLACGGEDGVSCVLNILKEEFEKALALAGCTKIEDVKPEMVVHESYYSRL